MQVDVIIPTYNRFPQLLLCLDKIGRQTYPLDQYRVVVVDDGSTDATPSIVQKKFPFPLIYCRQPNRGSAMARNHGVGQGQGDVLIFLDDDILVEDGFVSAIVQEHESHDRAIVIGTFRPCTPRQPTLFQTIYADRSPSDLNSNDRSSVSFTELTSNNVSVRRTDFMGLGMWQDVAGDGQTLWGDVDFAYRAHKQGFTFRRAVNAVCYHDDYATRDLATASHRAVIAAERAVLLFQRYPELIDYLPMFHDKRPVAWGKDSFGLSCRKLMRCATSMHPLVQCLEATVRWLERHFPSPQLLRPLYRWVIGAYLFRGYRQGLRGPQGASA